MTVTPAPYGGYDRQFIGGVWRTGASSHVVEDLNPFDGSVLTRLQGASTEDVTAAYGAALKAQKRSAATPPRERTTVMARAAAITQARHEEIVAATIRETGAVRVVAEFLWHLAWSIVGPIINRHQVEGIVARIDKAKPRAHACCSKGRWPARSATSFLRTFSSTSSRRMPWPARTASALCSRS